MPDLDPNLLAQLKRVKDHTILEVVVGSRAYGINRPDSDTDVKGVCLIPDHRLYTGLKVFEQQDSGWKEAGEGDKCIYHLPKFLKLAGDCNPNIIELLFVNPEHIRVCSAMGRKLIANRQLFLTKRARHTFSGYAHAQLQRIKAHKRWLDNPPSEPKHHDFKHRHTLEIGPAGSEEFSERTRVTRLKLAWREQDVFGAPGLTKDRMVTGNCPDWYHLEVEKYDKTGYEAAKKEWDHYQAWRKTRNEARAELEAAHHYDTKHAAHLVRLLRMGYEILSEGRVEVYRSDREELKAIRNGAWNYDTLLVYAESMDKKVAEAETASTLPWGPSWDAIEKLQMDMIGEALDAEMLRLDGRSKS